MSNNHELVKIVVRQRFSLWPKIFYKCSACRKISNRERIIAEHISSNIKIYENGAVIFTR